MEVSNVYTGDTRLKGLFLKAVRRLSRITSAAEFYQRSSKTNKSGNTDFTDLRTGLERI